MCMHLYMNRLWGKLNASVNLCRHFLLGTLPGLEKHHGEELQVSCLGMFLPLVCPVHGQNSVASGGCIGYQQ